MKRTKLLSRRPAAQFFSRLRLELLENRTLLSATPSSPALDLFAVSPALFVENQGQWADPSVRFVHNGNGMNVAMTDDGPKFQLFRSEPIDGVQAAVLSTDPLHVLNRGPDKRTTSLLEFSASFINANQVEPIGVDQSEAVFNYLVGDIANQRSEVTSFEKVEYEGLYRGIDLVTWGRRSNLKYEFHVAPGADYRQVQVHYDGVNGLSLAKNGSLVVDLGGDWGQLVDKAPYVYQDIDGRRIDVESHFVLIDSTTYAFHVSGSFDPTYELIVDPQLEWSTYLGGSNIEFGSGIAVDATGSVFVTGKTSSSGWITGGFDPNYSSSNDGFVVKLSSTGAHVWSTYLGGSDDDYGAGIAVDATGSVFATGKTSSSGWITGGFDTIRDSRNDGFVVKLSSTGAHVWSTYVGGPDGDYGAGIAVDATGSVFVTGAMSNPSAWVFKEDAFVVKLSSTGAPVWSTYFGGSNTDRGDAIAVDATGNVFVTGYTESSGWVSGGFDSSHDGTSDGFVVKLSSTGTHLWSTYLGGSDLDVGRGVAVDATGSVFVTGATWSSGWVSGGFDTQYEGLDAFVIRLSSTGAHVWSTYLGGSNTDQGYGIAIDAAGSVFVAGYSSSSDWVTGGIDTTLNGDDDVFLVKLSSTGSHLWSTYLGGPNSDLGQGIAIDATGGIFVDGYTYSADWIEGVFDTSFDGGTDGFVAKISGAGAPLTVGGLSAFPSAPRSITLRWNRSIVNGEYLLERSTTAAGPFVEIARVPRTKAYFIDSNATLLPGTPYFYRMRARAGLVISAYSTVAQATTFGSPPAFNPGPRIVAPSTGPSETYTGPVSFIDITFDEAIDSASFTTSDVVLRRGSTAIPVGAPTNQAGNTWRVPFPIQSTPGTYALTVGPNITDLAANPMNQNGVAPNGQVTADRFSGSFVITLPPIPVVTRIASLNRWWAYSGEHFSADLAVEIANGGEYSLDIDVDDDFLGGDWELADGSYATIDTDPARHSFGIGANVTLGELSPGQHVLHIHELLAPNRFVVQEVTFQLAGPDKDVLRTRFVSDRPGLGTTTGLSFESANGTPLSIDDPEALMRVFAPKLFFEPAESYPRPYPIESTVGNGLLMSATGEPILRPLADVEDSESYLDLPNPNAFPAGPQIPTVYSAVVPDLESDRIAINYWFHYPYNNWKDQQDSALRGRGNNHEGDWEGVVVFLQRDGIGQPFRPIEVAYAQHELVASGFVSDGGQLVDWAIAADPLEQSPRVFVALGSHASYYDSGTTILGQQILDRFIVSGVDEHRGGRPEDALGPSRYVLKTLHRVPDASNTTDSWIRFPGAWGQPNLSGGALQIPIRVPPYLLQLPGGGDDGPLGPAFQKWGDAFGTRWLDPWTWKDGFDEVRVPAALVAIEIGDASNMQRQLDSTERHNGFSNDPAVVPTIVDRTTSARRPFLFAEPNPHLIVRATVTNRSRQAPSVPKPTAKDSFSRKQAHLDDIWASVASGNWDVL